MNMYVCMYMFWLSCWGLEVKILDFCVYILLVPSHGMGYSKGKADRRSRPCVVQ